MQQTQTLCDGNETLDSARLDVPTAEHLAEVFKALSDPTRLRILTLLMQHEVCVHVIQDALGMTQSAISHQLRLLRDLRLVRARKEGRHVFYSLDDAHVRDLLAQALLHIQHE